MAAAVVLAGATAAIGQQPAGDLPSRFRVRVNGVICQARHDFKLASGQLLESGLAGTFIAIDTSVAETQPLHIVGHYPRIHLNRVTDDQGADLLVGAFVREDTRPRWGGALRPFVFPSGGEAGWSPAGVNLDWCMLYPRSMPASVRAVDGTVDLEVVTRDELRDVVFTGEDIDLELGPGVRFWMKQKADKAAVVDVGYSTDAKDGPHRRARMPIVNQVSVLGGGDRRAPESPVEFDFQQDRFGEAKAITTISFDRAHDARLVVSLHLVHETTIVPLPFHCEDLPVTRWTGWSTARRAGARMGDPIEFVTSADGFEVRLLRALGGARVRLDGSSGETGCSLSFYLGLSNARSDGARSFSRLPVWTITSVVGPRGESILRAQSARINDDRGTVGSERFHPRPILVSDRASDVFDRMTPVGHASMSAAGLPPVVSISGQVEFDVVVKDVVKNVPLTPSTTTELVPGVRLIVGTLDAEPNVQPAGPRDTDILIQVESKPWAGAVPLPMVNLVQLIGPGGKGGECYQHFDPDRRAGGIPLGRWLVRGGAEAVRVQVILETARVRIPFRFDEIPITNP